MNEMNEKLTTKLKPKVERLKCEGCGKGKGEPLYKHYDKKLCTICMFDFLRNSGYIQEGDVKFLGFIGDPIDEGHI